MITPVGLREYADEIREDVCDRCVERAEGGPPCADCGKVCGLELHLPEFLNAVHTVSSSLIDPYLETVHNSVCATCPIKDGDGCPCPMDYLMVLAVQAVETVDQRHRTWTFSPGPI